MEGEAVIGLEVHLPVNKLASKLFCSCPIPKEGAEPNTHTCPTCLGFPGSKPILNESALKLVLKFASALNAEIQKEVVFSRKVYFYVDMPRNYQITQYEIPLGVGGFVSLSNDKKVALKRVHLEEDPGALIHPNGVGSSNIVLVDYNRSGIPLCEVVTEPCIKSPEEARDFLKKLLSIIEYLGLFDPANGTLKCDANISIKDSGYTRVEVKNVSGFKEVESALQYEILRQKKVVKEGGKITMETRGWDAKNGATYSLRKKETEEDYGYIVDPDLSIIDVTPAMMAEAKSEVPELAYDKAKRLAEDYGISLDDAGVLAAEIGLADLFEKVAKEINPVLAARWLRRELAKILNQSKKSLEEVKIDEKYLIELLDLFEKKKINDKTTKELMIKLVSEPFSPKKYVEEKGLVAVSDTSELEIFCKKVIEENQKVVEDYKNGREQALNYLMGQVMKLTHGRASPDIIKALLQKLIG
ncbi:Asp-tRNA(Asn)/Glu-tRNA(Gln) amidotransferase subunit GatB [Candidatus Woesearchaeota archaeon]|nr:Asp-tRNA(Asn)/Glu-tRNA(Gln) amidotransferase subunit GatB [Candidatus Woesearchaeota archaeon]